MILKYCGVHLYNSRGLFLFFQTGGGGVANVAG